MSSILYLAIGSAALGTVITFVVVGVCAYLKINIGENLWVLAIPVVLAVSFNVLVIELHDSHKKK